MKSGTTFLSKLLDSHPSIFMCKPKEPCYFVEPNQLRKLQPELWRQKYWRSQEDYLKLFRSASNNEAYFGEASVYYTFLPLATGVTARIKRFSPNARLIYIMRDPTERAISHYWHRVLYNSEHRSLQEAIEVDNRYRDISYYAMQLRPYLALFGAEQIRTLTLEELLENKDETVQSIFAWLGLAAPAEVPSLQ
ncbi:MAG: sulfotransferase, partial [Hyphomicrobiales bacterium]|nr:sulfotransferase [Hyphomicrobiales bacterium]